MLLNGGQAADALVVGESLVIRCDQTHGVLRPEILQNLQADMAVEQQIGTSVLLLAGDHQRFDQADFTDGGGDLFVFASRFGGWSQLLDRQDVGRGDANALGELLEYVLQQSFNMCGRFINADFQGIRMSAPIA